MKWAKPYMTLTPGRRFSSLNSVASLSGAGNASIVMLTIFVQGGDIQMGLFQMMVFAIRAKGEIDAEKIDKQN